MTFTEALEAMRRGERVTRAAWTVAGVSGAEYVRFVPRRNNLPGECAYTIPEHFDRHEGRNEWDHDWCPSAADIMANDWVKVAL